MSSLEKINSSIRKENNITTNWDYRQYLINNADKIITHNRLNSCINSGIINDPTYGIVGNPPHLFDSTLSTERPFGYQTSDLKETFIFKRHTEIMKTAPKITVKK
tara:strand:- start:100 stop:414 length:315 start_codon:yes stop_codon:yes gene_type:complete